MAGEIHGLISREDAWRMWRPYGERVELDGSVDSSNLSNLDAIHIAHGSSDHFRTGMGVYFLDRKGMSLEYLDDLYRALSDVDLGEEPDLVRFLALSQQKQQEAIEERRGRSIENGTTFVKQLGSAVLSLRDEGLFTGSQVDTMMSWLIAPDGQPYMQYTPMTQLENARLVRQFDKEEATLSNTDSTDFNLGILRSVRPWTLDPTNVSHNRVHEHVHGSLSGVEMYDITREDGWRRPDATVIGVFTSEPSTEITSQSDSTGLEYVEVAEGWTDFIAREIMRVDPKIGKSLGMVAGYGYWANSIRDLRTMNRDVYNAITDATLVEATPSDPHAKRQAISHLRAYADSKLGVKDSLDKLLKDAGGTRADRIRKFEYKS